MFEYRDVISHFCRFWAEGRKYNMIATGITQNATAMLGHKEARNLVANSEFFLLHKQSSQDKAAWIEMLGLSDLEASYIDEGINPGEGLLIAGATHVPIKDDFPKGELYDLFNTKPDEIAELKRAKAKAKGAA
jgi:hypothetical protein